MDETYDTYVDDDSFYIHAYDDDTDRDTDDDTDDNTDYWWWCWWWFGNLYLIKAQGSQTLSGHEQAYRYTGIL